MTDTRKKHSASTPSDAVKQELEEWKTKADEYLQGWQRAKADYQNLRRDAAENADRIGDAAAEGLIHSFLPIADHFDRAMEHIPDEHTQDAWVIGLQQIQKQLTEKLEHAGVTRIEAVGKPFDERKHEAIKHEKKDGVASGTVLEESEAGYEYNGRILRPSKVTVAE